MSIYTYVYQPMADLHYIYDCRVLLFTDTRLLYNYNYYCLPSLRITQYYSYILHGTHPLQSSTPSYKYSFFLPVYLI